MFPFTTSGDYIIGGFGKKIFEKILCVKEKEKITSLSSETTK